MNDSDDAISPELESDDDDDDDDNVKDEVENVKQ